MTSTYPPSLETTELKSDLDKAAAARGENYCGSCYGGVEPANGCCQTCEEVRQAYLDRGWSFQNPDAIEQVTPAKCFAAYKMKLTALHYSA
jgi:7-cyano-7-deazaguanine synthase in queuosine biosynthesis